MKLKLTLILLLCCVITYSQSFVEVQLPIPERVSSLFIGSITKSTIHFGAKPPNYNGKVILFNHGYIDLNQTQFLFNNSFYKETYKEGYQAVFVATTRGEGFWKNGELLAESIDRITTKYHVPDVYIVAHSNGGKAAEAAMYHYGKKDKVKKVFALGTPFWGTYLANIAEFPLLNWAWRLTGLSEGSRTSTTYYCEDVVRPYFDNHPDNEPEKFVVLGTSGFYNGSTLAAPIMLATGGVLRAAQGVNDGVAPYDSTLRPGATYVYSKNDSRAIHDHVDVALGQFSWPYIKTFLENDNRSNSNLEYKQAQKHKQIESDYYIITSSDENKNLVLNKKSQNGVLYLLHENEQADFTVYNDFNEKIKDQKKYRKGLNETVIPIQKGMSRIEGDTRYLGILKQINDVKMTFEHKINEIIEIDFKKEEKNLDITSVNVSAILIRKSTLTGENVEENYKRVEFEEKNGKYSYDMSQLEDGVYSMFLNAEKENSFKRSLISGFAKGQLNKEDFTQRNSLLEDKIQQKAILYPTVIKNKASLKFVSQEVFKQIKIYDYSGRLITLFDIEENQKDNDEIDISHQLELLKSGIYLMTLDEGQTIKFIKE